MNLSLQPDEIFELKIDSMNLQVFTGRTRDNNLIHPRVSGRPGVVKDFLPETMSII